MAAQAEFTGAEAIRATKTHLDASFDFYMKALHSKSDKQESLVKALQTLGKASKVIFGLTLEGVEGLKSGSTGRESTQSPAAEPIFPKASDTSKVGEPSTWLDFLAV